MLYYTYSEVHKLLAKDTFCHFASTHLQSANFRKLNYNILILKPKWGWKTRLTTKPRAKQNSTWAHTLNSSHRCGYFYGRCIKVAPFSQHEGLQAHSNIKHKKKTCLFSLVLNIDIFSSKLHVIIMLTAKVYSVYSICSYLGNKCHHFMFLTCQMTINRFNHI